MTDGKILFLHNARDMLEMQTIKQALEDSGIPAMVREYHSAAFDGLFVGEKGYADISVFEKDFERAKSILEEFLK